MASREEIDMLIRGADALLKKSGVDVPAAEVRGISLADLTESEVTGEDIVYGNDPDARPQDDFQTYDRDEKARYKAGIDAIYENPEYRSEYPYKSDRPTRRANRKAKKRESMFRDGPETVPAARERAPSIDIRDVRTGAPITDRAGVALTREAQQRALRDQDRAAGRRAVMEDRARRSNPRYNPAREAKNAETALILQEIEDRIQSRLDIPDIEAAGVNTSANYPSAQFNTELGTYVDPRSGQPIAAPENISANISGANMPDTAQMLNAPKQVNSIDFVVDKTDPEGIANPQRKYSQVIVSDALEDLVAGAERVEGKRRGGRQPFLGLGLPGMARGVRNIDAVDKMLGLVKEVGMQANIPFYRLEGEDMRKTRVADPTTDDVLKFMGLPPNQREKLAYALQAMDKSAEGGRSIADLEARGIEVKTGLQNLPGESGLLADAAIGRAPTAKQEAFRTLEGQGAREPFIGATEAEGAAPYIKRPGNVPEGMEVGDFVKAQARKRAAENEKPMDIGRTMTNMEKARRAEQRAGDARAVQIGLEALGAEPPGEPGMVGISREVRNRQLAGQTETASSIVPSFDLKQDPVVTPGVARKMQQLRDDPTLGNPADPLRGAGRTPVIAGSVTSITPMGNPQPATPPVIRAAQSQSGPVNPTTARPMFDIAGEVANRARKSRMGTAAGITSLGIGAGTLLNLLFGGDDE